MEPKFNRNRWLRGQAIRNPKISLKEALEKYQAEGNPEELTPNSQSLSDAKFNLKKRWQVSDLSQLPRHKNGQLDMEKMLSLYLQLNGTQPEEVIIDAFDFDNLTISADLIKKVGSSGSNGEATENHEIAPRAGAPPRRKSRKFHRDSIIPPIPVGPQEEVFLSLLQKATQFAKSVGGISKAKMLIQYLDSLQAKDEQWPAESPIRK